MIANVRGGRGMAIRLFWFILFTGLLPGRPAAESDFYPVMRPDPQTLRRWIRDFENAPDAPGAAAVQLQARATGSHSLLEHLDYDPSERNQRVCGNCWVWSATGILEIALDVQDSIFDRLSIQYLDSCSGIGQDHACCGGNLSGFVEFYLGEGLSIPWANRNASFQDGDRRCLDGSSAIACGALSITPSYPLASLQNERILTHGVGREQAIANIKSLLDQDRAVQLSFFLADDPDWKVFSDFWGTRNEAAIVNLDHTCGHVYQEDQGGAGHAVLCVGYNDDDPDAPYWLMVNSWGAVGEDLRPNGTFRLDMDMNYDCTLAFPDGVGNAFYWETLHVEYGSGPLVNTEAAGTVEAGAAVLNGTVNPKGKPTQAAFEYGTSIPYTHTTSYTDAGTGSEPVAFAAGISGLQPGLTYHYRAVAANPDAENHGADRTFVTLGGGGGQVIGDQKLGNSDDDFCFIATAAYGSPLEAHVRTLRAFRDRFLLTTPAGRALVDRYYRCSPPLAAMVARHRNLRRLVRWGLLPVAGAGWLGLRLSP